MVSGSFVGLGLNWSGVGVGCEMGADGCLLIGLVSPYLVVCNI